MRRKMLVVIDYQNDFVDGALGFPGAQALDAGLAEAVRRAFGHGDVIVATQDTHDEDYLQTREGKMLQIAHCNVGTYGWKLYGETAIAIQQALQASSLHPIEKQTFGIAPAAMMGLLESYPPHEITEITLVGVVTNMCVLSNVCCFQAAYPAAQIIVDASLCAGFDPALSEKALDVLEGIQVKVINRGDETA